VVGDVELLQSDRGGERGLKGGMWVGCKGLNRRCSDRVGSRLRLWRQQRAIKCEVGTIDKKVRSVPVGAVMEPASEIWR
jgi:hypothetical protein